MEYAFQFLKIERREIVSVLTDALCYHLPHLNYIFRKSARWGINVYSVALYTLLCGVDCSPNVP